jgi:hypothetical protein
MRDLQSFGVSTFLCTIEKILNLVQSTLAHRSVNQNQIRPFPSEPFASRCLQWDVPLPTIQTHDLGSVRFLFHHLVDKVAKRNAGRSCRHIARRQSRDGHHRRQVRQCTFAFVLVLETRPMRARSDAGLFPTSRLNARLFVG